jgi:hypothetical protein
MKNRDQRFKVHLLRPAEQEFHVEMLEFHGLPSLCFKC